jgi:hypothetical protein
MVNAYHFQPSKGSRMRVYEFKAPHEKRRDEVRLNMRSRMMAPPEVALYN